MINSGAYELVWPVVYNRLTRRVEIQRGHHRCASGMHRLQPDCFDRFQDDVEAVIADLLKNAKVPIANLEGWVTSRLGPATVDAHRRRRGERGALQRPRMPAWLVDGLDHDQWLTVLALEVLVWVGVPTTAGLNLWPLAAWTERKATVTGRHGTGEAEVARDVDRVLLAMRARPQWYAKYVERPLGHKQAPVLSGPGSDADPAREEVHLPLVEPYEADDTRLAELAAVAVEAIEARLRRGDDRRCAVSTVLQAVFGAGTGADELDRVPGGGTDEGTRVTALLSDPHQLDRIAEAVLEMLPGPSVVSSRTGKQAAATRRPRPARDEETR
ncbi:hypothetical protein ACN27F_16035 [Solwaraspora sp. WMMB335]|uniref:hypothetical protein n=1 Tax=Solwaraspora sp. WMMB335 TaxID=3404118 RepID=UPI003B9459A4